MKQVPQQEVKSSISETKDKIIQMIRDFWVWFLTNYRANQWENPFNTKRHIKELLKLVSDNKEVLKLDFHFIRDIFEAFLDWQKFEEPRYEAYYSNHATKLYEQILTILWIESESDNLVRKTREKVVEVLENLWKWEEVSSKKLINFVKNTLSMPWWRILNPETPWTKGKKIFHPDYWTFASWEVDENKDFILDNNWIPKNFSFVLLQWWNLIRLKWWNIRYTAPFKK